MRPQIHENSLGVKFVPLLSLANQRCAAMDTLLPSPSARSNVLPSRRGGVGHQEQHRGRAAFLGFASRRPLCRLQPLEAIVPAVPLPQQGKIIIKMMITAVSRSWYI